MVQDLKERRWTSHKHHDDHSMVTVTFRIGLQVVGVSNIQFFLRICNNLANLVNGPIDGWLQLKLADKTLQQAHAYAVESKRMLISLSIRYPSFINNSLQAQPVATGKCPSTSTISTPSPQLTSTASIRPALRERTCNLNWIERNHRKHTLAKPVEDDHDHDAIYK